MKCKECGHEVLDAIDKAIRECETVCEICLEPSFGFITCEECFYDQDGEPRFKGF